MLVWYLYFWRSFILLSFLLKRKRWKGLIVLLKIFFSSLILVRNTCSLDCNYILTMYVLDVIPHSVQYMYVREIKILFCSVLVTTWATCINPCFVSSNPVFILSDNWHNSLWLAAFISYQWAKHSTFSSVACCLCGMLCEKARKHTFEKLAAVI